MVFQDYLLFPHLTVLRQRRVRGRAPRATGRAAARAAAGSGSGGSDLAALADRRAGAALGRAGAAGRAGPGARRRPGAAAAGRAAGRARRPHPARGAQRPAPAPRRLRRAGRSWYPRPARGDGAGRPAARARGRPDRPGGTPAEVARHPRTEYVARLVGLNLYRGAARGDRVDLDDGGKSGCSPSDATGEVHVALRPSAVALHRDRPEHASPRNVWAGRIAGLELVGDRVRVAGDGPPGVLADVTPPRSPTSTWPPGPTVWVSVKATEMTSIRCRHSFACRSAGVGAAVRSVTCAGGDQPARDRPPRRGRVRPEHTLAS